eukprot:TRINITY_DN90759_c0_g1_i1.p1 TRINITY_DN90759_c0_g1~~TRINITY_DN90759_c0_g1_i1.p1  ORF type:complete len:835 (-),score=122.51 TRINITY_DN90759_c0_g1_i1:221-2725(-)
MSQEAIEDGRWQVLESKLQVLVVTRNTPDMWRTDFLWWTLIFLVAWSVNLTRQGFNALMEQQPDAAEPAGEAMVIATGMVTCFIVAAVAVAAMSNVSSHVLERCCFWTCLAHLLIYAAHNAITHADPVEHFDRSWMLVALPMFRKTCLTWCIAFTIVSNTLCLFARPEVEVEASVDLGDVANAVFLVPGRLLLLYVLQTQVENFQLLRCRLHEKEAINKVFLNLFCDGFLTLDSEAQTILESDEKLDEMLGEPCRGESWMEYFVNETDYKNFLVALDTQVWPTPALFNAMMVTRDGRKLETELFLFRIESAEISTSEAGAVAVGVRLTRGNITEAPAPHIKPSILGGLDRSLETAARAMPEAIGAAYSVIAEPHIRPDEYCRQEIEDIGRREKWYVVPECIHVDIPLRQLGNWGCGMSFVVTVAGAPAACKVPFKTTTEGLLKTLRTVCHLRHPHVATFFGASFTTGLQVGILYEFVDGEDLSAFASRRRNQVDKAEVDDVRVCVHVAAALRYLHSQDPPVVHGDLKPKNVMVVQLQGKSWAKVLDSGLGPMTNRDHGRLSGTSLRWSAPEAMVAKVFEPKSDVYTLGCTVCFALTCCVPYQGAVPRRVQELVSESTAQPFDLDSVWSVCLTRGVKRSVLNLVQRCTTYDMHERPAAVRLHEELDSYLSAMGSLTDVVKSLPEACAETTQTWEDLHCWVLTDEALEAVNDDIDRHGNEDHVVWLLCSMGESLRMTVHHATKSFIERLGGRGPVNLALTTSPELRHSVMQLLPASGKPQPQMKGKPWQPMPLAGVRFNAKAGGIVVAHSTRVVFEIPGGRGSILKVIFEDALLQL